MDADERGLNAVFMAEASFFVRGRYFVVAGTILEGVVKAGDRIASTEPGTAFVDRTILEVEFVSSMPRRGLIGLCIALETDPEIDKLRSISCDGLSIRIATSG
jgi:hypothetical protein